MNLSDALMARIGQLVRRYGDPALQLAWVRAIEAALREEQEREIDSDRMPFILTKQAG